MTQDELDRLEADVKADPTLQPDEVARYLALVAEVRRLRKALEIAAEQFAVEASGTVEGHVAALLNEAREALEGA